MYPLSEKQEYYLREIAWRLEELDILYVGTQISYIGKTGAFVDENIEYLQEKIESIITDGEYSEQDKIWLNDLGSLFYYLRELHKDPINLKFGA